MTEKQVRDKIISVAKGWLGYNEENGSHKEILKVYNEHKPLAVGYTVQPTDEWCDAFASAVAIKAGYTDIIPTECGCERHVKLFQQIGRWQEDESYVPSAGDYIFYDWHDNGEKDAKGDAGHVGIVEKVSGNTITTIEGNWKNAVNRRTIKVNATKIRGYGIPDYASKATEQEKPIVKEESVPTFKVGDTVMFTGSLHYTSAGTKGVAKGCKAGMATITAIREDRVHSYHLKAVVDKGSTVYGWVNAKDVTALTNNSGKKHIVKKGDTLSKIAKKYSTTVNKLASLNGIRDTNLIHVGQIITIP